MIQKIVPVMASIALIGSVSITAYADDTLEQDYIVDEIWSDWWHGKGDDGVIFPEASYKHHVLTEWVSDNYGNDDYNWNEIGQLDYSFKDYYDELTDDWDFSDDDNGNWTIVTEKTTYHFNLQNGKWQMSDSNGNVVDSFMPFSTLEDDEIEDNNQSYEISADDNGYSNRVGGNLKIEVETASNIATETTEVKEDTSSHSNSLLYVIGGLILAGVGVIAYTLFKKKRG